MPIVRSVGWSAGQPECSCDLKFGPCQPASNWNSRVSGLVFFLCILYLEASILIGFEKTWRAGKVKYSPISTSRFYLMIGSNLTLKHFWATLAVCLVALNLLYSSKANWTSDAGSQYCCGWVGRGIQPSSTNQTQLHKQTCSKSIQNAHFFYFSTQGCIKLSHFWFPPPLWFSSPWSIASCFKIYNFLSHKAVKQCS